MCYYSSVFVPAPDVPGWIRSSTAAAATVQLGNQAAAANCSSTPCLSELNMQLKQQQISVTSLCGAVEQLSWKSRRERLYHGCVRSE
ncbi:hypothetical protein QQF64_012404 [Cirrhinus molitorella]|uniref:Uncharacterized protein n=1 Tax=Cirrhinus molitorella TaxID=172907 RepID=A0ABR3LYX4_9TELE